MNLHKPRNHAFKKLQKKKIAVIGSGAIGSSTTWHLAKLGHQLTLIDPIFQQSSNRAKPLNGTSASLGILMGNIFSRTSGRSWRLRKRSMELWLQWIAMLNSSEYPLKLSKPLIKLAASKEEARFMQKLCHDRINLGLELLTPKTFPHHFRSWPNTTYGGLISHNDGRINPLQLQQCLLKAIKTLDVEIIKSKVIYLERGLTKENRQWHLHLSNGSIITQNIVIICASLGSTTLLKPLGYDPQITPVLGQAINLKLQTDSKDWQGWPAVLMSQGINLIPNGKNNLLMGATLEPGTRKNQKEIENLKTMNGNAPQWIKNSSIDEEWSGIRSKPTKEPAPLLKRLEPGLIMATSHYRNGILLAPATAEWVAEEIEKEIS